MTITINKGEVQSIQGMGAVLEVCEGELWVTVSGNKDDSLLAAGQTFPLNEKGKVVVEALSERATYRVQTSELIYKISGRTRVSNLRTRPSFSLAK